MPRPSHFHIFLTGFELSKNECNYEYDFYGYSDYRGAGYNDTYYEDFYRTYDGEYFFDYPPSSMVGPLPPGGPTAAGGLPRTARNNVVGF
ncbi:hypothetical protein DOY81_000842 [Sarcophaga bullata]|nr:hypothetical protein DOY81_000842 [Sarcophaga bullata]